MPLRKWILGLRSAADPDPDAPVKLAVVSAPSGPMTVSWLQAGGIHAGGYEISNLKGRPGYQLLVPRHQLQEASELLQSFL